MPWMCAVLITLGLMQHSAAAQMPDGTLVFSNKRGVIGRVAHRLTGGEHYTHVGIVLGGRVYESDWPRATSHPVAHYGKFRTTNDYFVPQQLFSSASTQAMRYQASSLMGMPYSLRRFFNPHVADDRGTWCSPFVASVLAAGGRPTTPSQSHTPQRLLNAVGSHYQFVGRVRR